MLVSVHVPKCAGTSFRHFLQEILGEKLWLSYGQILTREHATHDLVPRGCLSIHGHFFADAFDDIFPERRLVTWVRHPVERVVANYCHFLRSPDMRDDCCRALIEGNLTLREFAELDWMRNLSSRYLAGKPHSDFEFIGIAEQFVPSLEMFCHDFRYEFPSVIPRVNVNPARTTSRYILSTHEFDYLASINAQDMEWYEIAVARFEAKIGHQAVPLVAS